MHINDVHLCTLRVTTHSTFISVEKFRSDVVDALVSIGVDYFGTVETGVPHFTAEYNGIHFVVTCVHTSSDVTLEDVGHVVEAKQVIGSAKGLLISNQPTIPSECLQTLEDAGCQFVPVSEYGEEGWEVRMIDKFRDVFSEVMFGFAHSTTHVVGRYVVVQCDAHGNFLFTMQSRRSL